MPAVSSEAKAAMKNAAKHPLPKQRFVFLALANYSLIAVSSAIEALRMANRVTGQEVYDWTLVSLDGTPVAASCSSSNV